MMVWCAIGAQAVELECTYPWLDAIKSKSKEDLKHAGIAKKQELTKSKKGIVMEEKLKGQKE